MQYQGVVKYQRSNFVPFSADAGRVAANLAAAYEQGRDGQWAEAEDFDPLNPNDR